MSFFKSWYLVIFSLCSIEAIVIRDSDIDDLCCFLLFVPDDNIRFYCTPLYISSSWNYLVIENCGVLVCYYWFWFLLQDVILH